MSEFFGFDDFKDKEEDAFQVVKSVHESTIKAMSNVYVVHGPLTESKKNLWNAVREIKISGFKDVTVRGGISNSYIFTGLLNTKVTFKNRVNHVLFRKCEKTTVALDKGTISGIDVLYCKKLSVSAPHNFTNIEFSDDTDLEGSVDPNTMIRITHSIDVKINSKSLNVNPFGRYQFNISDGFIFGSSTETAAEVDIIESRGEEGEENPSETSVSSSTLEAESKAPSPLAHFEEQGRSPPINISRSLPPGRDFDEILIGSPLDNRTECIHGSLGQKMYTSNIPALRFGTTSHNSRERRDPDSSEEFQIEDLDDF